MLIQCHLYIVMYLGFNTQIMSKEIDFISTYLADDLSSTNLYDIASVRAKIKASLIVLLDEEIVPATTKKLNNRVATHIRVSEKQDIELKFWKDAVRGLLTDKQDISKYYEQIDSVLIERGYKALKPCT